VNIQETRAYESQLLGKVLAGDEVAFNDLYSRYNKKLTVFAFKMLGQRDQAADLAQDTWSRLLERREKLQEVLYVAGYLFQIARNLCFDRLRVKREHSSLDELPEEQHPISSVIEKSDLEDIIVRSLEELSAEDKELLVLHNYLGYGYDEIAEMQSKSPEAVWTRASRARGKLREIVRNIAASEGVTIPGDEPRGNKS
jgi:RNA polymerase sigma-70 factor, ECF subfamily